MARAHGRNWPLIAAALTTAACALLWLGHGRWWRIPGLDRLERAAVDARFLLRGAAPADPRIVIVGLDDETRRVAPEVLQTRRGYARLLDALAAYHPKIIALDFFFSAPEVILDGPLAAKVRDAAAHLPAPPSPNDLLVAEIAEALRGDEVLAAAIAHAGTIYLGANFRLIERREDLPTRPPPEPPGLERARHGEVVAQASSSPPPSAFAVNVTMPALARGAVGAGAVNVLIDPDGVIRRVPLVIEFGTHYYLPLGLAVALAELGAPGDTSYVVGDDALIAAGHRLPVEPGGAVHLDFRGANPAFTRISAADVLSGAAPKDALAGKLVFVGMTYAAMDKVATPLDPHGDGVELHATLADNVLTDSLFPPPSRAVSLLALVALCGLVTAMQLRRIRRRAYLGPVLAAALIVAWLAVSYVAFTQHHLLEAAAPAVAVLAVAIVAQAVGLATEGREKAQLRAAFGRYVSKTLVERVLAHPELARLGGERRTLSVLFSDIRGFSRIAESLAPEALVDYLNQYLTPMTKLVLDSDGTLDKYIGDAVMAVWGAPLEMSDHATRACATALAMIEGLAPLNAGWRAAGRPEIAIGIGINTGAMAVGNMGSEARFDYTVMGDAVNLASRLEALTKEFGVAILVGPGTATAAVGFVFRELDRVRVKGRDGAAAVFELLGATGSPRAQRFDRAAWDAALDAYRRRDFADAATRFGAFADDPAAATLAARAWELAADPPGDDWDGVYEQRSK
ncbi:MAG: adenylate/guanylate cyclase domain-containing protein [Deltaproteobacteria bacterium]|nr:adenylate/guanylate cyclase domain-containing protein [Deltaproteobacteria bacterium]